MRSRLSVLFALLLAPLMAPAAEGQQLFSDFPVNGQISAFQVNGGYSTSNSFTLSSSGTIGEMSFGAWVNSGDSVTGVTWAIGTTPYDTSLGTGVSGATSLLDFTNVDGFDVNIVTFAIPGTTLPAGTYYLTLSNATSASGNAVYWDINNAPGVDAWNSAYGHVSAPNACYTLIGISGTCAESFQLVSTGTALTALPSSVSFANQTVGSTSAAQMVTITNTGAGAATVSGIAVTGTNPGDFAQTNNCPLSPATIAASGTCTINVTFTPQSANPRSAAITITGSSPLSIGLSGTGTQVPSTVTLLPSSISFASQAVNTTSGTQGITVTNSGPSPLMISSIGVTGANTGDFAQFNNCPLSPMAIAVNGSCTINVAFAPQATGTRSAAITITDNGSLNPQSAGLSGTGTPAASQLAFTTEPPSSGTAGTALSPVVVQVEDVNGNLVTGSSAQVTISSTPAGVGGTLTANAVNGVATFNNLAFTAGGSYTLSAASTGLTGATSSSILISGIRPTSQYIFGSQADIAVPTASQSWTGLMPRNDASVWQSSATTGDSYALMPTTGTFSFLCVNLTTAPGAGASWTWTLYKNGADQPISVKISGAQKQACDLADTTGFVPGDLVALHVTPSAGPAPASTFASWYIVQTPQVPGETILFTSQQAGNAQYLSLAGNSSSAPTEVAVTTVIPAAGTVTKFIAEYLGTGTNVKEILDQNESATALSASLPNSGVFVEQAANLSVFAGDVFDVSETGITASSAIYASIVFVPNVAGQYVIPTWRNTLSDADPVFYLPLTGRSNYALEVTDAGADGIGGNLQIQGMYVRSTVAPGSGTQYAFTLRDNGANTALSAALSGTNLTACTTSAPVTGCGTGSAIAINNLDLLDTGVVPTGSPANPGGNGVAVSYLAFAPQLVFTTEPPSTGTPGTALSPVVVELQDDNGNAITGSTAQVTIASSPAGVGGTLTVNAVNGVATFSSLVFNTAGTYTLTASVSGLPAVSSSSISIGAGSVPVASLTSALAFSNTAVGTTSAAMAATLSNTGNGALNNIAPSITGTNPGDFAITTGANACGATLAAGSSCSIYVTFTPASAASFSATLSVADNATGSPQTASLTGTGTSPAATLTASLAFPNTATGTTSAAMAATLSNTGNGALNNIVPSITGTNPGDFAITTGANACGATLAAGSSCSIYVTFTPASAASFSATLSVADNASGPPQTSALSGTGVTSGPTTWPNGYNYEATFTVASGQVPSAQTNFPALISGTWADFATTANGGRISNTCTQTVGNNSTSVPCDLIFTSDAAGTQLLSWEFETWNAATGASNIWVNVPNLANGTVVYAWYGQSSVTTLQTTPSATWTNYMAVYHMKENPAGVAPQLNDSTGNGNNATMNGPTSANQQQAGEIDGSINFEGNTWASLASASAFSFERTDSFSLSGWYKIGANTQGALLTKVANPINGGWTLMQYAGSSSPQFALGLWGTNASTGAYAETPQVSMGVWHYVVATYSGTGNTAGMSIYVDGVNQTLTTKENNLATSILNNSTPAINSRSTDSQNSNDAMDELRVSAKGVVFPAAWVTATFNNEKNPGSFFTVVTGMTNP